MATNDFLPFGTATGANVLAQSAYAALAARGAGFASGTAQSIQLNKVWRQAAFWAALAAQFTADRTGLDVLDDGDLAGKQLLLENALGPHHAFWSPAGTYTWTVPAGVTRIKVICTGGGGASGGGSLTASGGGGGAGGTAIAVVSGLTPGSSITVTVGAGGTGTTGNGGNGGSSSFGSYCSVGGGYGGQFFVVVAGGSGGGGASGDYGFYGGYGNEGSGTASTPGGSGGASFWGSGGRSGSSSVGVPGQSFGSGGGAPYGVASAVGGAGAAGFVLVEW